MVVRAFFELQDLNGIDEQDETFEFTGVMTLRWHDPRQAFDPATAGVDEKIYQGDFQFDELSPGWFPQVVLLNGAGSYEQDGVLLRVRHDGESTLVATLDAAAKVRLDMRRFPIDRQRLEAVFAVLGFDSSEVALRAEPGGGGPVDSEVRLPQWRIAGFDTSDRDRVASYAGRSGVASTFVVTIEAVREPFYITRLVILPLIFIVLLSFSVFWMDRASVGDRMAVSFIGILTGVAYQIMLSDRLPRIAYFTLMHAVINFSFLVMCGTVVINLVVGVLDRSGKSHVGDRIDRRCRWLFPLAYFALLSLSLGVALLFF